MDRGDFFVSLTVACLIRVPSEVVKQRAQVSPSSSTLRILSNTVYEEGILGLYRGYKSTVLREIPFSLVQFPLWECLKIVCWHCPSNIFHQSGRLYLPRDVRQDPPFALVSWARNSQQTAEEPRSLLFRGEMHVCGAAGLPSPAPLPLSCLLWLSSCSTGRTLFPLFKRERKKEKKTLNAVSLI
uniref:Mitochondrial S-adenosylmethionine carrier protein n=1 Tax=Salvator merianae TaxID=96440 RepID=A0A8D0B5F6_SALMN